VQDHYLHKLENAPYLDLPTNKRDYKIFLTFKKIWCSFTAYQQILDEHFFSSMRLKT